MSAVFDNSGRVEVIPHRTPSPFLHTGPTRSHADVDGRGSHIARSDLRRSPPPVTALVEMLHCCYKYIGLPCRGCLGRSKAMSDAWRQQTSTASYDLGAEWQVTG
ncbi:hypothetical protein ABZX51_012094 [Aspergillus tubingensis]